MEKGRGLRGSQPQERVRVSGLWLAAEGALAPCACGLLCFPWAQPGLALVTGNGYRRDHSHLNRPKPPRLPLEPLGSEWRRRKASRDRRSYSDLCSKLKDSFRGRGRG